MLCLCAAQLKFWFQTDLGRENSASYLRQRRQLLLTLLTIVMCWSRSTSNFYALIGQNWTGEFMPKIYAASRILFTLTVKAYRLIFVSTCDVFNRSFHWMYKMKFSCYSWLVCLLGFWLRNTSLVKAGNPISDGMVFVLRLAWCVHVRRELKVWSDTAGLTWYFSGAASRMVSLSNYCIDVCVFNSNLMKPSVVFYVAI